MRGNVSVVFNELLSLDVLAGCVDSNTRFMDAATGQGVE